MIPRPDSGGSPSRRGTSYQQMSRCAPSSVAVIVESVRIFELRPSAPTTRSACSRCRAPPRVYSTPTTRPPSSSRSSADARAPISTRNPGKRAASCHHERQEPALRDQRVVRVLRARAPVVGQPVGAGGGAPHERVSGAVRHGGEQRIGEPQIVENLEHGRGQGVATEPAVEVGPGLEQRDRHARPGQQVGQHHPARAAADDRAAGGGLRGHGSTLTARRTPRRVGAPRPAGAAALHGVRQPCTVCATRAIFAALPSRGASRAPPRDGPARGRVHDGGGGDAVGADGGAAPPAPPGDPPGRGGPVLAPDGGAAVGAGHHERAASGTISSSALYGGDVPICTMRGIHRRMPPRSGSDW